MSNKKVLHRIDDGFGLAHPIHPDEIVVVHTCGSSKRKIRMGCVLFCSMCRTPSESVEFRLTYGEFLRRYWFPNEDANAKTL